ncbi:MAG: SusC/RagA family TonB-linked outer membrane protein [Bacteroides stercoris]
MRKETHAKKNTRWMKAVLLSFFALLLCSVSGYAQNITVTGKVSDAMGTLPGVSVAIKGTTNGTVTDVDGKYSLNVAKNATLVFSFVGMKSQEVTVNGRKVIDVTMTNDTELLDEVVVVGYGTSKKSSLTSAVSAVKGDELLKAPATNVSQLLGGRLPGISSLQESGEPGLDQASLKIRGSVYSVSYIVDGFPVSNINDLDPNDIESVSVLKDGASAAVYGLAGAGGVIIVTTKRGEAGKTKVTYDASYGVSMNANFPKFMNGPQYAHYYNMAQMMDQLASGAIKDRSEYTPYYTQENIAAMTNGDPTDGWDNVDYIDKVFGTGTNQKHSVTVQGGNEKMRYFTSLGYLGQNGNIDNFTYRRYNLRANIESEFAKHFNFKLGVSGVVGRRSTPAFNSGGGDDGYEEVGFLSIARQTIQMHPYLPERYNDMYTAAIQKNTSLPNSPMAAIYESGYKKTRSFEGNVNLELTYNVPWVKGLALKANGSYNYSTSHNKNLNTLYSVMGYNNGTWSQYEDPRGTANGTELGEGQTKYEQMVGQASINYANSFGLHNVEVLALVEARDNKSHGLSAYAKNLPFIQLPELGSDGGGVPTDSPIGGWSAASRTAGYVFRLKYDYDSKYMAEFTGRYDGSYKFYGMGKRWGFFLGFIGMENSKENFMESLEFVNDLKVRASVGLLGNDAVSEYAFLGTSVHGPPA